MPSKKSSAAVEDAKVILNKVRQIVRALRLFDKEVQARHGVGAAQVFILHTLGQESGLTVNEVADRTATDQSSVSIALRGLIEKDLVKRATSEADRRQATLTLTDSGKKLFRKVPPPAQERIIESAESMSAAERKQLLKLLSKLMSGMDVDEQPGMLFQEYRPRKGRAKAAKKTTR